MLAALLHHLLPPTCLCCQRLLRAGRPGPLCGACHDARAPLPAGLRSVAGVEACFAYEGSLAAAVAALKFGGRGELAPGLAALLADAATAVVRR
ncbi:MAG: hypothetical protein KC636_26725 [Myxococcales bacterium]|nr:hypothetical protein [Myxococcales bacterium]